MCPSAGGCSCSYCDGYGGGCGRAGKGSGPRSRHLRGVSSGLLEDDPAPTLPACSRAPAHCPLYFFRSGFWGSRSLAAPAIPQITSAHLIVTRGVVGEAPHASSVGKCPLSALPPSVPLHFWKVRQGPGSCQCALSLDWAPFGPLVSPESQVWLGGAGLGCASNAHRGRLHPGN